MSDFSKRHLPGRASTLSGDVERALSSVRSDMRADSLPYDSSSDGVSVWVSPAPSTIGEAIRRIASALSSGTTGVPIP